MKERFNMATIKDVAKKAGVSVSTASYALNNIPLVHPDTRKRVLDVAALIHYHPNASARNLKTKKTNNIGVFVYGFSGPVFSELLEGINKVVHEYGFNIIVSSGKSSSVILKERQVDAAIIFDSSFDNDVIREFSKSAPVVILDTYLKGKNIYPNLIDNVSLVNDLMTQMIQKGHKRFAYVSGPKEAFNNTERYKGYSKALHEAGIENKDVFEGDFTTPSGYKAGKLIAKLNPLPDFVYCANDEMAIGVMNALTSEGISIPKTIAVAGFDGSYLNNPYIQPSLTTITIDHHAWGKASALFLIEVLQSKTTNRQISIPIGNIMLKEST